METAGQVFISYCGADSEDAQRICRALEERGIPCWIAPRNIPPGQDWPETIPEAIKRSSSLLLLMSSSTRASSQIGREVSIAAHNQIRIINFRLENVDAPTGVEYFVRNLQWVDGFSGSFESGVASLEAALKDANPQAAETAAQLRKRERSPNRKLVVSVVIAFVLALAMQSLEYYGWFAGPDGRILDSVLSGRPRSLPIQGRRPVSVLEIDDGAFFDKGCFNGTSPLKPALVKSLVGAALSAKPRVVGVDIFTEGDEYRDVKSQASEPTVIWISGVESDSSIEVASLPQWLLGGHDHVVVKPGKVLGSDYSELKERRDVRWGVPAYPADDDSTLRRFTRQVEILPDSNNSRERVIFPSWVVQVMQAYCATGAACGNVEGDELYLSYDEPEPDHLKLLDYFSCRAGLGVELRQEKAEDFKKTVQENALLIGGTFRSPGQLGDYRMTAHGKLSGLIINAYAVRSAIEGSALHDIRQPWALLLDFAIGVLVALIFHRPLFRKVTRAELLTWLRDYEVRCEAGVSFLVLLTSYVVIRWWPGPAYLKGFTGVCLGVLLHHMIHSFLENPKRAN